MVDLALILGAYAYGILALGLLGLLYKPQLAVLTLLFLVFVIVWGRKKWKLGSLSILSEAKKDRLVAILLGLLGIQIIVNFLGALAPELSFDALWYHLTTAKLYLENHRVFYFPGIYMWVSNTPRLGDLFFIPALSFSGEILAKLVHFSFGLLCLVSLFNLLKRYLNLRYTVMGIVTFYTMLVVGWQSTTAYVDLIRTFFEILALDLFLKWIENKKREDFYESALIVGMAISTKMMAFGSLATFLILIFLTSKKRIKDAIVFGLLSLIVVAPWLILSAIYTGNPVYPLGSSRESITVPVPTGSSILTSFTQIFGFLWKATLTPDSIISPVFLVFLPLVLIYIWRETLSIKIVALYFLLESLIGLVFLNTQSNRYLLPFLAVFTLVIMKILSRSEVKKLIGNRIILAVLLLGIILNLGSRILATRKFVPYLTGKQTKHEFLSENLNYRFGDFYDIDGWFSKNIKKDDLVLVTGIHNLYYLDFPYVYEDWAKKGTYFTHILVGNFKDLPKKYGRHVLIYRNYKTGVSVYIYGDKYQ